MKIAAVISNVFLSSLLVCGSMAYTNSVYASEPNTLTQTPSSVKPIASKLIEQQVCDAMVTLTSEPLTKQQTLNVDETSTLTMHQFLTANLIGIAKVVSNVTCQQLSGAQYTGSDEEWAGVIKNALDGIQAKGATDIEFIITNDHLRAYHSLENNKEYDFKANFGGNKQIIKNFTLLDKTRNTVYTLSVSGSQKVEAEIVREFKRLVASFNLITE